MTAAARHRGAAILAAALTALACNPLVTRAAPSDPEATPAGAERFDAAVRREVAAKFAQMLADNYAYADKGAKMAAAIRARLKAKAYDRIASPEELAKVLQAEVRAIDDDPHLRVIYNPYNPQSMPQTRGAAPDIRKQSQGSIPRLEILDGNIGYMRVDAVLMFGITRDPIAAAFAFLHNTAALIIDLRGNGGGMPPAVALFMSYLSTGASYVVNTVHFRMGAGERVEEFRTSDVGDASYGVKKPVFVLTSHRTFSGGEELAYDIQAFKRGVLLGETTGGGANPDGLRPLGHGFTTFLPTGYAVHPVTKSNWEGVGVKPDTAVPAEQALTKAELLAVQRLKAGATDPEDQAALSAYEIKCEALADGSPLEEAQLLGRYGKDAGDTHGPTVARKDGKFYFQIPIPGTAASEMIATGGGHYRLEGMLGEAGATFLSKDGKTLLVVELTHRPPMVLQKLQ